MSYTANTRLNDYLRNDCRDVVRNLLSWRMATIEPPFTDDDHEQLLRTFWGDDVRDAQLRLHALNHEAVNMGSHTRLHFRVNDKRYGVLLQFEKHKPVIEGYDHRKVQYDPALWPGMTDWLQECISMMDRHGKDIYAVAKTVEALGTYGQLLRMWPDFVQYLPGADRLAIARTQVRRSPLPSEFPFSSEGRKTLSRFELQEKLHDVTTRLAEGALLKSIYKDADGQMNKMTYTPKAWPEAV